MTNLVSFALVRREKCKRKERERERYNDGGRWEEWRLQAERTNWDYVGSRREGVWTLLRLSPISKILASLSFSAACFPPSSPFCFKSGTGMERNSQAAGTMGDLRSASTDKYEVVSIASLVVLGLRLWANVAQFL